VKIAWAAMTVGKPNKEAVKRHSGYWKHEIRFRWSLVLSTLDFQRKDKYLANSFLLDGMDP